MSNKLVVGALLLLASGIAAAHDCSERGRHVDEKCRNERTPPHAVSAPEMEVASAGAALALLAGGIIVLRGRKAASKV